MDRLAVFCAAFLPSLLILAYAVIKTRTHWSNEALWNAFFLGTLSALLITLIEAVIRGLLPIEGLNQITAAAIRSVLIAATPEEAVKFILLIFVAERHVDVRRKRDVIAIAVSLSLGFAAVENLFYLSTSKSWQSTAIARALLSVPMHGACGLMMGSLIVLARLWPERRLLCLSLALVTPIIFHAGYNFPLFATNASLPFWWAAGWIVGVTASASVALILCNWALREADRAEGATGAPDRFSRVAFYVGFIILIAAPLLTALAFQLDNKPPAFMGVGLCIYFSVLGLDLIWSAFRRKRTV